MVFLQLHDIPMESLNQELEGWSWYKLDSNTIAALQLELKGYAEVWTYMYE